MDLGDAEHHAVKQLPAECGIRKSRLDRSPSSHRHLNSRPRQRQPKRLEKSLPQRLPEVVPEGSAERSPNARPKTRQGAELRSQQILPKN